MVEDREEPQSGSMTESTAHAGMAPGGDPLAAIMADLPQARPATGGLVPPPLSSAREAKAPPASPARPAAPPRPQPAAAAPVRPADPAPQADPLRAYAPEAPAADDEPRFAGFRLPQRATGMSLGRKIWFAVSFIAPVVLGGLYIFAVMPNEYLTEFRFSVRVPVGQPGSIGSAGASLSALFGGNPTPGTDLLDNFTVADYVRSPQAASDLDHRLNLKAIFNKASDPFSRLGDAPNSNRLAKYWKAMSYADYDVTTGLAIVRVKAYTAQDSFALANALLAQTHDLVNQIGQQSQQDTVHYAQEQVNRASDQVHKLRIQIAALSQRHGFDSPSIGVISANQQMSTASRQNIAAIQAQIAALMQQLHNPNAPQIVMLRQQLKANEVALGNAVDAANTSGTASFNDLTTQLQAALTVQTNAQAALSQSLAAQDAQRLYLTTYVKPQLADAPNAPDRWMDFLFLVIGAGMVWLMGLLARNSVMEHGL